MKTWTGTNGPQWAAEHHKANHAAYEAYRVLGRAGLTDEHDANDDGKEGPDAKHVGCHAEMLWFIARVNGRVEDTHEGSRYIRYDDRVVAAQQSI